MNGGPHKWRTLTIVGAAFFMTVLDVSIVNVALPSIGKDLGVSNQSLEWVVIGYSITFGGFLLLGGRTADLLGRKSVLVAGLAFFTIASLVCGFANSIEVLIVSRVVQGVGAATMAPSSLAIVMTEFEEGAERNKALGIWGALGGSGAAVGVLAGGILTSQIGWEWVFLVNVPVGTAVLVLTLLLVRDSRMETEERHFDALGALTATASLVLVTYAISKAPDAGWTSTRTLALLAISASLTLSFVLIELRARRPLMPLNILRVRSVAGANLAGFLLGGVIFANFFLLTLYVQQVLGWSSLRAGITFLATAGSAVLWSGVAQALVTRLGQRLVLSAGFSLLGIALLVYTQLPVRGTYVDDLLPGYLIFAAGLAFAFVSVSVAALEGVSTEEAGLASGLINTNQQIGGAVGVAIAATVLNSHTQTLLQRGTSQPVAATESFQLAFWVLVGLAFAAALIAALVIRGPDRVKPQEERAKQVRRLGRRIVGPSTGAFRPLP